MLKGHFYGRAMLAAIAVSIGIRAVQNIPAFPALYLRGRVSEHFFSGRIPLYNHAVLVHRECGVTSLVIDGLSFHDLPGVIKTKSRNDRVIL
jgi:hypothetical protein